MIIGGSAGLRMMIALPRAAPPTSSIAARGGLGELVDIGARARPGRFRGDRGDDLGIMDRRDRGDRGDDRDRRLAAAGDHVDVGRVEMGVAIDHRDDIGADGRRRQVDHHLAVLPRRSRCAACARRRRSRRRRSRCPARPACGSARRCRRRWSRRPVAGARAGRPTAGSMPTSAPISSRLGRCACTLIIRSVPILPEPMIAAFALRTGSRPADPADSILNASPLLLRRTSAQSRRLSKRTDHRLSLFERS